MRFTLIASIVSASLSQSVFALMVERASIDDLEPFLGVPSQIRQGDFAAISMAHPLQAISKITLNLKAPNGTTSSGYSSDLFVTNSTETGAPSSEPTTRFCVTQQAISQPTRRGLVQQYNQVGDWSVFLHVTYHYGANGYEYDADKVCISPPFTSETADTEPIIMKVVASSGSSSGPVSAASVTAPSPTPVDFQGEVTGTPFLLSTSTAIATGTVPNSAQSVLGWRGEAGVAVIALTFLALMT